MVNEYELLYIVHPRRSADEVPPVIEWVSGLVTATGGEVLTVDNWGRRRLAYPINHEFEGTYVLTTMQLPPEATDSLESQLVISEDVMRHMLIAGIIPYEPPREREREEPQERREPEQPSEPQLSAEPEQPAAEPVVAAGEAATEPGDSEIPADGEAAEEPGDGEVAEEPGDSEAATEPGESGAEVAAPSAATASAE